LGALAWTSRTGADRIDGKWFSVLPRLKPCQWQDSTGGISHFQPAFDSINPGSQLVEGEAPEAVEVA
jgi:hypothetical protein